jgi:gliding motility-associated-like protein
MRHFALVLVLIFLSFLSLAQDCSTPVSLCSNVGSNQSTANGDSIANIAASTCIVSENSVFFSFTTIDTTLVPDQQFNAVSEVNFSIENIICNGDSTFGTTISAAIFTATDLCDGASYTSSELCENSISSNYSNSINNLLPATTYYILIDGDTNGIFATNAAECSFDINVSGNAVEYNLNAIPAIQDIIPGEEAILNSTADFENYLWSGEELSSENTQNTSASPSTIDEIYTYTLEAELDGCTYTDQVTVRVVPPITVYNTFTPNDDGANDTWYIGQIESYPDSNIKVFSRWGQPVYSSIGYNNQWDGDGLPAATYYYVIELNPLNNKTPPITGNVTIIY